MSSRFTYVTYIRTTPEKLWAALTKPEFTRQYWFGVTIDTDWKVGSPWKLVFPDGRVADSGEVLESQPPKRLVLRWRHHLDPEAEAEGYTVCTFDIESRGNSVRLSVVHESQRDGAKVIGLVSGGWPAVLAGLKSLLETGTALDLGDRAAERAALKTAERQ